MLLGCYNAQRLGKDYELLLRITNGKMNDELIIIVFHEPAFETSLKFFNFELESAQTFYMTT